jgi:hypothetical protein
MSDARHEILSYPLPDRKKNMNQRILFLAISSTLALSACGGGGGSPGGSTTPPPVQVSPLTPITAANSKQAAANGYAAADLIGNSSTSVTGVLTGVSVAGPGISAVAPVLKLVKRATGTGTPLLTGVTTTQACTGGGTVTVDANLSNAQKFSNGDTMSLTARNCIEDGNTLNGTLAITIGNVSGDLMNTWVGSVTMDTRFTGFSIVNGTESATVNGDMKIGLSSTSQNSQSLSISGNALQTTEQRTGAAAVNMSLTAYSLTGNVNGSTVSAAANFTLAGNANGLGQFAYTVKNLQPFVGTTSSSVPSSGAMIVNGAASSVTVTALNASSVRLDYSAKGDGVITQTATLSWAEFLAAM